MSEFAPGAYQCPCSGTWYLLPGPVPWPCLLRIAEREGWALVVKNGKTFVADSGMDVVFEERDTADDWKRGIKP